MVQVEPISKQGIKVAIVKLKRKKLLTESQDIPEKWQEGEIHRVNKDKGGKGKYSNERGITLSRNLGKLYEWIMNERITCQSPRHEDENMLQQ